MAEQAKMLIVDDELSVRDSLGKWFQEEGYSVSTSENASDALTRLAEQRWDVALVDIKMRGTDGIELQRRMHEIDPNLVVIMMTGYASVETAVTALKNGAYDYVTKPLDPDEIAHLIKNALAHKRTEQENVRLRETVAEVARPEEIIGQGVAMKKVFDAIETVAPTDATVLITGESGTGKELVARAVHHASQRRFHPLVVIHCGALTETLLESELFGHEKGAFTGAQYRKKGKFEIAEGGTVFLDEIGDISLKTQTDLLRVLQEHEIMRVGGNQPIKVDFRCIAATNKDLEKLIEEGKFRPDLFYRLNVFRIELPPLRERRDDIPALVDHFVRKFSLQMNKKITRVSPSAMSLLQQQPWIGNVVFAHKSTAGWEAILSALLNAGWVATASWPVDTEMGSRMNAMGTASLASSVHIVCRPREDPSGAVRVDHIGDWRKILHELPIRMREWLPRLADEGVVGADAIFACLGPALEIFSQYSKVEKVSGEAVTLREYLEHVWAAVSKEALSMIFEDADTAGLEEDARLSAMWLWTLAAPGESSSATATDEAEAEGGDDDEDGEGTSGKGGSYLLEFDAARKIAQGLGVRLNELSHLVEIKGDKARLLGVTERTKHLFGKAEGVPTAKRAATKKQMPLFGDLDAAAEAQGWGEVGAPKAGTTTLNRVHQAMLLFGSGRSEALKRFLVEEGIGKQAQFWKLAQSLSALYPSGSDEKRWVDGVLARKKGLGFG